MPFPALALLHPPGNRDGREHETVIGKSGLRARLCGERRTSSNQEVKREGRENLTRAAAAL